jgi:hypothetical protein
MGWGLGVGRIVYGLGVWGHVFFLGADLDIGVPKPTPGPKTLNQKPETPNPEPQTLSYGRIRV